MCFIFWVIGHLFAGSIKMQFYKDKSDIQSSRNWFHFLCWGKIISFIHSFKYISYTACHYSSSDGSGYRKWSNNGLRCVCVNVLASQGCDQEGNGLCPVLTLSSVGDVLGSCGGEWEDAWWSPSMQKIPQTPWLCPRRGRRWLNAISTLPNTFVLRNRCTSEGHCIL